MNSRLLTTFFLSTLIYLLSSLSAKAGDYQQCITSSTCTIGEFLYDDSYTALPSQTCTLNAKYPNGTAFITSQAMTSRSDGWYSYDASVGTTEGLYTATICCTPATGAVCLDKSFEVKTASGSSLTPAAIWGYSDRTLTSYGSLVSDIWSYSSRSLTSFGSLVSDIWGYSGRTMTSFGSLITDIWGIDNRSLTSSTPAPSTLQNIITEQTKQRELLEKLVNAPIVTLSLEDNDSPDLSAKLGGSKQQASTLYDLVQTTKSRLLTLDGKWSHLGSDALNQELTTLAGSWTDPSSLSDLSKSWNNPVIHDLIKQNLVIKSSLTSLIASITVNKGNAPPSTLFTIIDSLSTFENALGDVSSESGNSTLFGFLAGVSDRDALLQSESQKLSLILEDWDGAGESVLTKRVKDSQAKILAINDYPGGDSVVTPSNPKATGKDALKNLTFSLQGLIGLNRNILASSANSPIRGLWLEEGSIIFRAVITNPSNVIAQAAPLKFYLPKELKIEDIITLDSSLSSAYDLDKETLVVTGTYDLGPGDTRIVSVEVQDIWKLKSEELTALKTKISELMTPLQKTTYLSQGLVLKSSIEDTLTQLLQSQSKNVKPENRIRAYREAQLKLANAKSNMTQLENLVAQASSNGSILGFVGGVGTTATFGIILVVVAGFVFLSLYFKKLGVTSKPNLPDDHVSSSSLETPPTPSWQMPAIITVVVVITSVSTIYLTRLTPFKNNVINQITPSTTPVLSPSPIPSLVASPVPEPSSSTIQTFTLTVPEDSSVNLRNNPTTNADIVMSIKTSEDVLVFNTKDDWTQIGFSKGDEFKGYWVSSKFIVEQ